MGRASSPFVKGEKMSSEQIKNLINELENKLESLQMKQSQAKDKLRNLYETLFDQAPPYASGILTDISKSYPSFFPQALELYRKYFVFEAIGTICTTLRSLREIIGEQEHE